MLSGYPSGPATLFVVTPINHEFRWRARLSEDIAWAIATPRCHDDVTTHRKLTAKPQPTATDCREPVRLNTRWLEPRFTVQGHTPVNVDRPPRTVPSCLRSRRPQVRILPGAPSDQRRHCQPSAARRLRSIELRSTQLPCGVSAGRFRGIPTEGSVPSRKPKPTKGIHQWAPEIRPATRSTT